MQYFLAIEWYKPKRWRYHYKVYEIVENRLVYLTMWSIQYASTRWQESEVMNLLAKEWFIPPEYVWSCDSHHNKPFHITYNECFSN